MADAQESQTSAMPSIEPQVITPKKRVRFKPGTVALREIKKLQKSTHNILQRAPFARMVRKLAAQYGPHYKFSARAMNALQDLTEAYIIDMIQQAHAVALYTGRKSLKNDDLTFVQTW